MEVVQKFLEYGVNIKIVIKYNRIVLYIAAGYKYVEVVQIFLEYSTKVDV